MSFKKIFFTIITLISISYADGQKPLIAASTFALYDVTKNVAKESAEVFMILPYGSSVHTFEPSPKDVVKISKSSIVFYSGAGLEPWVKGFKFKNKSIDISGFVKLRELGDHHDDHHHHEKVDPHYWLDIENMILATKKVQKELGELFPQNKEIYAKNASEYILALEKLDEEYKKKLSSCKLDTIVVNHNAFSYLSSRYNFHTAPLSGLSPEAEPSAKTMIKLVELIKSHKVKVIFSESFASDKAMKSVSKEAGVKTDILQPLGNITADEAKEALGYIDIMRRNLQKISNALECK